jgi:release factor glutamine methyltransferase
VTLALELGAARTVAVDISPTAVTQARRNAEALGAEIEVLLGDGLELLEGRGPFDLLVSNPPYVTRDEARDMAPEVLEYEPEVALFAPDGDPDHWVRRIVGALPALLAPDGLALIELGWKQSERVVALARAAGLAAELHQDLARIPRVLELRVR